MLFPASRYGASNWGSEGLCIALLSLVPLSSSFSVERGIDWELVIPVLERLFSTSRRFRPNNILLLSLFIIARGSQLSPLAQDHKCSFPFMTRQDHSRILYMHCNNDTVQKNKDHGAMLNKIEGHGMDELVLDIIINPTIIIQTQIGSWVNWSWTSSSTPPSSSRHK